MVQVKAKGLPNRGSGNSVPMSVFGVRAANTIAKPSIPKNIKVLMLIPTMGCIFADYIRGHINRAENLSPFASCGSVKEPALTSPNGACKRVYK